MPPASMRTEVRPSSPAIMRLGIESMRAATNPMIATRTPKAPTKAANAVVAGTEPAPCHFAAVMDRPRTMTAMIS